MLDNKRAQIGETTTWVIATIVIVVILIFSIFIVSFTKDESKKFENQDTNSDLLAMKSLSGYLLTQDQNGIIIYEQLKNEQDLNEFNGNLAFDIFKKLYEKDYGFGIWMGITSGGLQIRKNKFFDWGPLYVNEGIGYKVQPTVVEKIFLNQDKYLELILIEK